MNINELLDVVEYGLKYYYNDKTGKRMNLIEYYSLTDLSPSELGKVALSNGRPMLNVNLREYEEKYYWQLKPLDMECRLRLFHSIKGKVLSSDDKLTIQEKMEREGFPLMDGVFDLAARHYVDGGVDAISKEQIRNTMVSSYNKAYNLEGRYIEQPTQSKNAVLVK